MGEENWGEGRVEEIATCKATRTTMQTHRHIKGGESWSVNETLTKATCHSERGG